MTALTDGASCADICTTSPKSGTAAPGLESLIKQIILPTTESRAESRAEIRAEISEEAGAGDEAGGVGPPQHLSAQDVQDLFPNMENMDGEHTDASDELMTEARHEVMTQVMTAMEVDVDEEPDIMAFTCRCPECCPELPLQEVDPVQTAAGADPILIPNPKQGGQRTDSLKKRRIFKKTTTFARQRAEEGQGGQEERLEEEGDVDGGTDPPNRAPSDAG